MVPLKDYATVSREATLREAVRALEKAQSVLEPMQYHHRAILVLDKNGNVLGKLTMKDILIALEPNYGKLEGMDVLIRSGHSAELINSMLEKSAFWHEPLQFVCERAVQLKVKDVVMHPGENEHVDENAPLGEAIHQLIVYPYNSLLVTRDEKIVGILRLSDVFATVCEKIKNCKKLSPDSL